MLGYMTTVNRDIDELQWELDTIANLTQGTDETIQYMKDSVAAAQKSSPSGKIKRKKKSVWLHCTSDLSSPKQLTTPVAIYHSMLPSLTHKSLPSLYLFKFDYNDDFR